MKFNEYFFFTIDFKIKVYTWVIDELVNEWDSWFQWVNIVTLHSVQGETSSFVLFVFFAERKIYATNNNKNWDLSGTMHILPV